jgi:hypothetical protein
VLSHGVNVGDVVTFTLLEEDENDDDSNVEDDEMLCYEQAIGDNVFEITVAQSNWTNKPFDKVEGTWLFCNFCHFYIILLLLLSF